MGANFKFSKIANVVETAKDLTLTDDMDLVVVDASSAPVTLLLPKAMQGHCFRVKRNFNDHSTNAILVLSDTPDTQQFDVDGDNGFNLGSEPFYDFVQQDTKVYVC